MSRDGIGYPHNKSSATGYRKSAGMRHGKRSWPEGVPLTPHRGKKGQSVKGHGDYPTHHTSAHGKPPHLTGSGNKADGRYGKIKDVPGRLPGRGLGSSYLIEDGSRAHLPINVHPDKERHLSMPGHTEQYPFRRAYDGCNHQVPHAFRAHHHPASGNPRPGKTAHGSMNDGRNGARQRPPSGQKSSYNPLRFSNHPGAHQVGDLSGGRCKFGNRQEHVWGKTPVQPSQKGRLAARGLDRGGKQ